MESWMKTRTRNGIVTVAAFCFLMPFAVFAQERVLTLPPKQENKNQKEEQIIVTQPKPGEEIDQAKARAALNTMYTALGGQKWLNRGDYVLKGHTSSFYKNEPTGVGDYIQFHRALPNNQWEDRLELTKKRDIVQIWTPTEGVEVTYRGRKPLPKEDQQAYFRRIHYSLDSIANTWLTDPQTLLVYGGHKVVARREVDEVTLIDKNNDSVTVDIELSNHYPLRRVFQFRNEKYKDFDEDVEEYSDWHEIDGIPTPFVTTRYFNGDMVAQRFVEEIHYKPVDPALFAPNAPLGKHKD
jgi:hypothetical protein